MKRLPRLFRRKAQEHQLDSELRFHLEHLIAENIAAGMSPETARREAAIAFGGMEQVKEDCREARGHAWVGQIWKDLSFTVRSLLRARGYTITVLFTLVLGISVTTLVYNIAGWILFNPSPYPQAERLFFVGYKDKQNQLNYWKPGLFLKAYQDQAGDAAQFAASGSIPGNVVLDGEPVAAHMQNVTIDAFDMLGIRPALGRGFMAGEDREGFDDVVVISDGFWKDHFGGRPDVLGQRILIDQNVCVVVGVLAKDQALPYYFGGDVFKPLVLKLDPKKIFLPGLTIIARLKPGVTPEQAVGVLSAVKLPTLPSWAVATFAAQSPILSNIMDVGRHDIWWVLVAAGGFLYSIACLNTINLMLIRLLGRRRELSIRFALGGSRWQVLQILLIECAVLSSAACMVAFVVVYWSLPAVMRALNGDDYSFDRGFWDLGALSFVAGLSALTCALTAIAPVFRLLREAVGLSLKDGSSRSGESLRASRFRTSLVILQAAFAVVLLVGTGLMVRSFHRLQHIDLGFDPVGMVKVRISAPRDLDLTPAANLQLYEHLQANLTRLPGVRAVSYAEDAVLNEGASFSANIRMADGTLKEESGSYVAADFQKTARLTMKRGQWLSGKTGLHEIVINDKMSRALFGDLDPVGRSVEIDLSDDKLSPYIVVGVAGDVRPSVRSSTGAWFYAPAWQGPKLLDTLILRLDRDPGKEFAGIVRRAIYAVDPRLSAVSIQTIGQQIGDTMWAEQNVYTMLKGLATIAFVLTIIGLFSVISFTVDSRMPEFGVRAALGATAADLVRIVMRRGLASTSVGLAAGIAAALASTRFMQGLLFETEPFDPMVYAAVALLLMAAAAAACWLPARRAARVDVVKLLRSD
jgi:predicted permease